MVKVLPSEPVMSTVRRTSGVSAVTVTAGSAERTAEAAPSMVMSIVPVSWAVGSATARATVRVPSVSRVMTAAVLSDLLRQIDKLALAYE